MPRPIIALVIGHTSASPGAVNRPAGLSEYAFNAPLATDIVSALENASVNTQLVYRSSYRGLPAQINALKPNFIISLHCNAYNTKATGTETLYYHSSRRSQKLATILQTHLVDTLELADRGIKPKSSEDRGGYLLRYTHAPCVIAEPFFIDNSRDLQTAQSRRADLVEAYANTILDFSSEIARD